MYWDWIVLILACVVYLGVGMFWAISLDDEYGRHHRFIDARALWWVICFWFVAGFYCQGKINKHKRAFF